jgi:hypothetical protein
VLAGVYITTAKIVAMFNVEILAGDTFVVNTLGRWRRIRKYYSHSHKYIYDDDTMEIEMTAGQTNTLMSKCCN